MLKSEEVRGIIFQALRNVNDERSVDDSIEIGDDTHLFGEDGVLDSLSLVTVIVDIELAVSEASGKDVCLTDDLAMNQEVSPFSSVKTLTKYIELLLNGAI